MKKILITSTDAMMLEFMSAHALFLHENGYRVEVACSNVEGHIDELRDAFKGEIPIKIINLSRKPLKRINFKGYHELKNLIDNGSYDLIWTNEPVMGAVTRMASRNSRKKGTRVMYVAHGFHFYKGAPLKNWVLYYPIEKILAKITDLIITITKEDYTFAQKVFKTKVEHIYGIGARTDRYSYDLSLKSDQLRDELGIKRTDFLITCVGELNDNKNQIMLIKAVEKIHDSIPEIIVFLAGPGENYKMLKDEIQRLGLEDVVYLLGYRSDLNRVIPAANLAVACSYREGLPINVLEAMCCGKPVIATRNRGHNELIQNGRNGFLVDIDDVSELADKILYLYNNPVSADEMGIAGLKMSKPYGIEQTKSTIYQIISNCINGKDLNR